MPLYCLKCKMETETTEMTGTRTKNNRKIMRGVCSICGRNKSVFVRAAGCPEGSSSVAASVSTKLASAASVSTKPASAAGKGFSLNNLVNSLPIEIHQFAEKGENVPGGSFNDQQKYSYCGPGTRYVQRIREGYKGINELDSMCKLHDQFYNENTDTPSRNISDEALAIRADQIAANQNNDSTQRKDARFLSGIMRTKARLGLGLSGTKNCRRRPGMKH